MNKIYKVMCIALGLIFLSLGVIGVVLPILPTTPFLLLASFFFARGSEKFHKWFMGTSIYKRYIKDFIETRSMTRKNKIKTLTLSTSMLILAIYLVPNIYARIFIGIVMVINYCYFFFRIKERPVEAAPDMSDL